MCVRESTVALHVVMSSAESPLDPGALSSRSSAVATWISCSKSTFWLICEHSLLRLKCVFDMHFGNKEHIFLDGLSLSQFN